MWHLPENLRIGNGGPFLWISAALPLGLPGWQDAQQPCFPTHVPIASVEDLTQPRPLYEGAEGKVGREAFPAGMGTLDRPRGFVRH